jgi:hypothetical protein
MQDDTGVVDRSAELLTLPQASFSAIDDSMWCTIPATVWFFQVECRPNKAARASRASKVFVLGSLVDAVWNGYGSAEENVDHHPANGPGTGEVMGSGKDGEEVDVEFVGGRPDVRYPQPTKPFGPKTMDIVPCLCPTDWRTEEGMKPPSPTRPLRSLSAAYTMTVRERNAVT